MSGNSYLADTNCFIYLLAEHPIVLPLTAGSWTYSFITEMELLCKKGLTIKEDKLIRQMLATCYKCGHNDAITEFAIKIRRQYALKLPDAIVAATAQYLNMPLLTADKAFASVKQIDSVIIDLEA